MTDLVVPQLGESITEAVVAKWLVQVGETVAIDQPLVDLETDKVTVQLPSPSAGALTEQRFAVGATVRVGDVVGAVDPAQAGKAAAKPAASPGPQAPAPAAVVVAPPPIRPTPAPAPAPTARPVAAA
ncbi:MAG: hypothetical protein NT062_19825, partial [Proteobacteria bacterium]|nr:hypothetical protein [Pseudomonadota bacterium]